MIGDFGMAKETHDKAGTVCGTPQTMAPEILNGGPRLQYDNRADLWSVGNFFYDKFNEKLGVTLHMMLCGQAGPFSTASMPKLKADIERYSGENLRFPPDVNLSEECKALLRSLLQRDPDNRITWYEFFHHKIFPVSFFGLIFSAR